MSLVRSIAGRLCSAYYFVRSRGKVRGQRFLLSRTSLIRAEGPGLITIGDDSVIGPAARLVARDSLSIANGVFVGKNVTLVAFSPLHIGEETLLGENVSIHTENHGGQGQRMAYTSAPITIGRDVWIGAGVVVLGGAVIGDGATIGANAVVTGHIPAGATAVGVPARVVRRGQSAEND